MTFSGSTGKETDEFRITVSGKLAELKKEAEELTREISERQGKLANLSQLIKRLEEVLELSTLEGEPDSKPTPRHANYREICELVEQILAENPGTPMHFQDIADEVQRRGIILGGKDPGRTLVAKLVHDARFVRPERKGYYALRADFPDSPNVGARKTIRRENGGNGNRDNG